MSNPILSRAISETAVDEVEVHFDWRPAVQNGRVVFQADIVREGRRSAISFQIDLHRLEHVELEQLNTFLARRHAGLTDGYAITRTIVWLLDISLRQNEPLLSEEDRCAKVRELLMAVA